MANSLQRYFDLAESMALKSDSRFRLGAVLVRKRRIISAGFNQMRKTHPIMQSHAKDLGWTVGLHAEVHACLGVAPRLLEGSDVYVVRIKANGETAMAKPCSFCARFLSEVGIRAAHFTTSDGQGHSRIIYNGKIS